MNAAVGDGERLVVMLEARVNEFERRMRTSEQRGTRTYRTLSRESRSATRQMEADMLRSTSVINTALASTSAKIGSFGKAFLGSFAIGAVGALGAGALAGTIRSTVAELSGLAKVADRIGITTEALQGLQRGFDLSGVAAGDLNSALEIFTRNIGQAAAGGGAMAPVLDRYKISVTGANGEMKGQLALLKEVADVMRALPSDAQRMDLATKAFGRGGAAMVNAMREGGGSLDAMIDAARDAGVVIEDDLIRRAEILDDRFAELGRTVSTWFKTLIVGTADAAVALTDFRAELDRIFATPAEARAILGDDLADALEANRDAVDENAEALGQLNGQYLLLGDTARQTANDMRGAIGALDSWGYDEIADALREAQAEMDRLSQAFQDGEISGDDLAVQMAEVETRAREALAGLDDTDRATFNGVISQLGRLGGVIAGVTALANSLRSALSEAVGVSPDQQRGAAMRERAEAERASMQSLEAMRQSNEDFLATEQARNTASAEQLRLQREIEAVRRRMEESGATFTQAQIEDMAQASLAGDAARSASGRSSGGTSRGGRSSGGGASAPDSEFQKAMDQTRERIAALEAEAISIIAAADSGREYGDALEYARKRAELMNAAQRDGRAITPELTAEIDRLAEAYMTAGLEADAAAEKMTQIQQQTERGKSALEGMFGSIIDGSMSAKDAVANLLAEIAKAQMLKGLFALPGMGALSSGIGGLLGYASGGYTGAGPRDKVAGVVHGGEYVFSKAAVDRLGVGALEKLHRGVPGFMAGGLVPGCEGGAEIIIERKSK